MERFGEDAAGLLAELESAGIETRDFGRFGEVPELGIPPPEFDYARAMPILIKWLPLVETAALKEVIARGMTGEPSAAGDGARVLLSEFRRATDSQWSLKWTIGNALSTLADPGLADDLIALLQDRTHGISRQMLCEALRRTKDPQAPEVLTDLISDPDVGGHAIAALRDYGPKSSLPYLESAQPALERVLTDPNASDFARRMAKMSLERLAAPS